ncbi:asparagine synthase-related protein [uncultured Thiohalocapsa sp.]|uniref:asparagine synthase-related protein n=1 Tax=uncultured Thiohalocapsa sp. TaxID=768990 RepID=UPI0025F303A7|nr:asparagine synthase-related protein [uncultured Thiohalocapsa sp.]
MAIFALILHPPGVTAKPTEVQSLLEPIDYMGDGEHHLHAEGRVAVGTMPYTAEELADDGGAPKFDCSGRYLIVGDIRLNCRSELAAQLRLECGVPPADCSDQDLVLAAFLRWGDDCCRHFDGDYAFALYDLTRQRLFAAGDALACYRIFTVHLASGALLLTSELSCALAAPGIALGFSMPDLLLSLSGLPLRTRSLFEGIGIIPPGSSLIDHQGERRVTSWWSPEHIQKRIRYADAREYGEHYRELLQACVNDRMRTRSGTLLVELSGGLDSSSIAALALRLAHEQSLEIVCISHVYDDPDCNEEMQVMRSLWQHFGVRVLTLDGTALTHEYLPLKAAPRPESPMALNHPFQIHGAREADAIGADVILCGTGGDEMTKGRPGADSLNLLLQGDWSLIRGAWRDRGHGVVGLAAAITQAGAVPLLKHAIGPSASITARRMTRRLLPTTKTLGGISPRLRQAHIADAEALLREAIPTRGLNTFEHEFLLRLRTSASLNACDAYRLNAGRYGITAQHPFFDLRIASFQLSTPPELWGRLGRRKLLPRQAMRGLLPKSVCDARKFNLMRPQLDAWDAGKAAAAALTANLDGSSRMGRQLNAALDFPRQVPQDFPYTLPALYALTLVSWVQQRCN